MKRIMARKLNLIERIGLRVLMPNLKRVKKCEKEKGI